MYVTWSPTFSRFPGRRLIPRWRKPESGIILRETAEWFIFIYGFGTAGLVALACVVTVGLSAVPRFHTARARRGSVDDARVTVEVWAITSPVVLVANYFFLGRPVPTLAAALALGHYKAYTTSGDTARQKSAKGLALISDISWAVEESSSAADALRWAT